MQAISDRLVPPIADDSGYEVRARDLLFLRIAVKAIPQWRGRRVPLGMSRIQFRGFKKGLADALHRDGISVSDCDIRLKGSAAEFFSGPHKRLPHTRNEIIDLFRELRRRIPEAWEVEEIMSRLERDWVTDGDFPTRRPFDSMYRLGISRELSDFDLQISNDLVVDRCEQILARLGQPLTEARLKHREYNFIQKDLVDRVLPSLYLFCLRTADSFNRGVSVAVFPSEGPPAVSGDLSAHFRDRDWRLQLKPPPSASATA